MDGPIIGDIAGKIYEGPEFLGKRSYEDRLKILDYRTPLFTVDSGFTDDTILTTAIADAILHDKPYEEVLREYGLYYLDKKNTTWGNAFGKKFIQWLKDENNGTSIGNGSAMRVAPIGFYFDHYSEIIEHAERSSLPSHNSTGAVKGAISIAEAIFMARNKESKKEIKEHIEKCFGYDLNFSLDKLQRNYTFSSTADGSVPQAIYAFTISNDFEDGIRKALSIGGDTDTIACMAGGILEAYYGVPEHLIKQSRTYLDDKILGIVSEFYEHQKTKRK